MNDDPIEMMKRPKIDGPQIVCCNCGEGPIVSLALYVSRATIT